MALYIAFTADDWIAYQRRQEVVGVTDWWTKPTSTRFRRAQRGDWFCFRPRSATHIVGWGSVVEYVRDRASAVWNLLPRDNGLYRSWQERARRAVTTGDSDPEVASIVLADAVFLAPGDEVRMPADYRPVGTREGLRYEDDEPVIAYLIARCRNVTAHAAAGRGSGTARRRAAESLVLDAYVRRTSGGLRVITPLHNRLADQFAAWLSSAGYEAIEHERDYVDVRFRFAKRTFFAELKVCHGLSTRAAIREALGQIVEYNLYDDQERADTWWIVLDERPTAADERYVARLRDDHGLPLFLVHRSRCGFVVAR